MFFRANPFYLLGGVLSLTALLIIFSGYRLQQQGQWLPSLPSDSSGAWAVSRFPLSQAALTRLGNPQADGRRFTNLFSETVEMHVIATRSLSSYSKPDMLLTGRGFGMTAEKIVPLFGRERPVRALILRSETSGQRILMYYWVQYKDGSTGTSAAQQNYKDIFPKLRIGLEAILRGEQSCIVRVFTQVHPADKKAVQARRNLNDVGRSLYETMTGQKVKITPVNTGGDTF